MDLHSNYLTPADNYLCFSLAETRLASFDHRLAARGNLQFAEYVGHLVAHGLSGAKNTTIAPNSLGINHQ